MASNLQAFSSFTETLTAAKSHCDSQAIVEETLSAVNHRCTFGAAATALNHQCEAVAARVITVKKRQSYQSTLDTIWEETIHYVAEQYLVSEAAHAAIFRPSPRLHMQPSSEGKTIIKFSK